MFKIQTRNPNNGRWQDLKPMFQLNRYPTEEAAWAVVESFDQDGYRDVGMYRVVKA